MTFPQDIAARPLFDYDGSPGTHGTLRRDRVGLLDLEHHQALVDLDVLLVLKTWGKKIVTKAKTELHKASSVSLTLTLWTRKARLSFPSRLTINSRKPFFTFGPWNTCHTWEKNQICECRCHLVNMTQFFLIFFLNRPPCSPFGPGNPAGPWGPGKPGFPGNPTSPLIKVWWPGGPGGPSLPKTQIHILSDVINFPEKLLFLNKLQGLPLFYYPSLQGILYHPLLLWIQHIQQCLWHLKFVLKNKWFSVLN